MNEAEVTQMLRDAIDQDPKGRVWHVNTKHLVAFAQMVADKTKREMASQAWEAHLYEQGEVKSKEDQKKADEAAWADARIACAAIRDAALDAAGEDSRSIATIYFNYAASCVAVDDHWDAVKAKRGVGCMKTREELVQAAEDARAVKINDLRAHDAAKDAYLVRYEAYANCYKDKENT
jgi:hypothetical protein